MRSGPLFALLLLSLGLQLVGCPSPADGDDDDDDAGDEVTSPDGQVTVGVPEGAYSGDEPLEANEADEPPIPVPDGTESAGPVYEFTPHGATFAEPVTINLPFNVGQADGDLESMVVLRLGDVDVLDALWERVDGASFSAEGVASFPTNSFSWYTTAVDKARGGVADGAIPCDEDTAVVWFDLWSLGSLEEGATLDVSLDVQNPKASFQPLFGLFDSDVVTWESEAVAELTSTFACTAPAPDTDGSCPLLSVEIPQSRDYWVVVYAADGSPCTGDSAEYRLDVRVDGTGQPLVLDQNDATIEVPEDSRSE
ncbi:MAG: hypothetical protein KDA24_28045 [Deltaproteobacteria bacterium]|nr:hypothetical protein [Deltaproteobacteria bacterium]